MDPRTTLELQGSILIKHLYGHKKAAHRCSRAFSQLRFVFALVCLFSVVRFTKASTNTVDNSVGSLASIQCLSFVGNNSFSAESLKSALNEDLSFRLCCRPKSNLTDYLKQISKSLQNGYLSLGFPDASVTASASPKNDAVLVSISEGRRYVTGDIHVLGAKTIPVALLKNSLTDQPYVETDLNLTPFSEGSTDWTSHMTEIALGQRGPIWRSGTPVNFNARTMSALKRTALSSLWDLGYLGAVVDITLKRHGSVADLQIMIQDEGPVASIDHIEIGGNITNTTSDIIKAIGLSSDHENSFLPASTICRRLWRCGRFSDYSVRRPSEKSN